MRPSEILAIVGELAAKHPAWPAYCRDMLGRSFGIDATEDSWAWFRSGWDECAEQLAHDAEMEALDLVHVGDHVEEIQVPQEHPIVRALDITIGRLDRQLSEFLLHAADPHLDEADRQTIKHHADDLIGVGQAAYGKLGLDKPGG